MSPLIHRANASHLSALVELEFSCFRYDRISQRSWRDLLNSPAAIVMVAEDRDTIIGSYVLLLNARTSVARLYSLAVAPEARQRKVAQMLIEDAIDKAPARGASILRLETRFDNEAAQKLFEKTGFRTLGRVPNYYEDGAEAIRYERPLPAEPASRTASTI
jgi:ribosomal-protein-alanine N-acetyltransferase